MWSMPTTAVMGKDRCRRTERWLTKPLLLSGAAPFCEGALLLLSTSAAAMHSAIRKAPVSTAYIFGTQPLYYGKLEMHCNYTYLCLLTA